MYFIVDISDLSDCEGVFSMLRRRIKDEKVNVRKAAVHALECAVRYEMPNYTKQVRTQF